MKKICLILFLFSVISVMPSFALKLIVNNELDRTVPSRCSGPSDVVVEEYINEESVVNREEPNIDNNEIRVNLKQRNVEFERIYKPILEQDFRTELLGTRWVYPAYEEPRQVADNNFNQHIQNAEIPANVEVNNMPKRYIREAADYYTLDTIKNPNEAIPAGYVE